MTSKERLLTVLKHGQPDRVPISTYDMTGWSYDPRQLSGDAKLLRELFFTYMTGWWNREPSYSPLMEKIREKADCIFMTDVTCTNDYVAQHTPCGAARGGQEHLYQNHADYSERGFNTGISSGPGRIHSLADRTPHKR